MFNLAQIFTVDLNNWDKLFWVKFKIQFENSIQDCDIVESNSSFELLAESLVWYTRYDHWISSTKWPLFFFFWCWCNLFYCAFHQEGKCFLDCFLVSPNDNYYTLESGIPANTRSLLPNILRNTLRILIRTLHAAAANMRKILFKIFPFFLLFLRPKVEKMHLFRRQGCMSKNHFQLTTTQIHLTISQDHGSGLE